MSAVNSQLAADRDQASITIGSLRGLRERQDGRLTKVEKRAMRLAEQALGMFLKNTINEFEED
jgi:hypothetical protein